MTDVEGRSLSGAVYDGGKYEESRDPIVKKHRKKFPLQETIVFVICVFFALLCLFPIWLLIVNATKETSELKQSVSIFPSVYLFDNVKSLFDSGFPIMSGMLNSFIIAMSSTVLCVYFSMLTAYGFVAYEFKAKKQLYGVILASMVVPSQLGMIGWYQLVVDLGMYNTWIPLILPSIAAPTTVFFLKQYLETSYSRDIVEAARIDGSGEFHTFNSIILPISVPALATMAIFSFVYSWNNYLGPIMILNSEELYTLPMLVQMLKTNIYATDYGLVYAGILLTILPLLIVYLAFSRFIIGGVAIGGVKE